MMKPSIEFVPGAAPPSSIITETVAPVIDAGRYAVKREVGDTLQVSADVFKEGHDQIAAVVRYRLGCEGDWREAEMHFIDNDRWGGEFPLEQIGRYQFEIEAFPDFYATWSDELRKKADADFDVTSELLEGAHFLERVARSAAHRDQHVLGDAVARLSDAQEQKAAVQVALSAQVAEAVHHNRPRDGAQRVGPFEVVVDPVLARFAAWYEIFPRSAGTDPSRSATFHDVIGQLPRISGMGFDVLYFTPIHPIGTTKRKGKNNTLIAEPGDPGVPYAIGSPEGGHDAFEPSLGTAEDFRALVDAAGEHGLQIALDLAIQASPDHPWVKKHPAWFYHRPDGTIKYAENPPKKYEDIYPINFQNEDWQALWHELKRIILHWIDHGVTIFRVDNPHTKPTIFWEWLIGDVKAQHPEAIFLSEAFTRPKVMKALAKAGFTQSYTYFTWRNFKRELIEYLTELTQTEMKEYFRGNFFVNTHDILPYILQEGGRPAFQSRVVLAATLSSLYGIYSGYELCENTSVPGKEEYLHSEKYEFKARDWNAPGNIADYISRLNQIRRDHPALHEYDNLRFYPADDDNILCYGKVSPDGDDNVLVVVNLDPFHAHETMIHLPLDVWGIGWDEQYRADELLGGETYIWTGGDQYVRLDPHQNPAAIYHLRAWLHQDYAEPCF
jgi:starch synthase (maltosyl-transferring)